MAEEKHDDVASARYYYSFLDGTRKRASQPLGGVLASPVLTVAAGHGTDFFVEEFASSERQAARTTFKVDGGVLIVEDDRGAVTAYAPGAWMQVEVTSEFAD